MATQVPIHDDEFVSREHRCAKKCLRLTDRLSRALEEDSTMLATLAQTKMEEGLDRVRVVFKAEMEKRRTLTRGLEDACFRGVGIE